MTPLPVDHEARERARNDHGTRFVLEAGAGTGKTTLLIERVLALVRGGHAQIDQIAAVTFTDNAATTIKLRLRERLEKARVDPAVPGEERGRAERALQDLERAPISTIHSLCAAILQERPLECGVIPGFRMADEAETDLMFAQAWEEWMADRLVEGDRLLLEAMDQGMALEGLGPYGDRGSLRGLARTLLEQRDLAPLIAESAVDPSVWRDELLVRASRARELAAAARQGDVLAARLEGLVAFAEQARFLTGSALVTHLLALPQVPRNFGFKPHWPTPEMLEEARGIAAWTKEARTAWAAASGASLHGRLVTALLGVVRIYEREKTERGVLDFLDLLLKARNALRDRESVHRYFSERFRFLIIDEFQDTDPLQVEIARLLADGKAGGLVVVGDAKQSIYRFRRAEVSLFRRMSAEARTNAGQAVLHLTQNFRSRPAILRFVNRVFAELIRASDEADQPEYEALDPPPGLSDEPSVVALRFAAPYAEGEDLLIAEARALARFLAAAARGAHALRDPVSGMLRPSRAGDVMVLTRRFTQLRHLEDALRAAGLRFVVEGGKSFFDRIEVREVLGVIRAIDDPSDRVSLVAALRSSFFGVSDRDIVSYVLAGGSLGLGEVEEERPGAEALGPALDVLSRLHKERLRLSIPALLDTLYDETRVLAALAGSRRGDGQIANLEKVVSLARQAAELGVLTLRGFATLLQDRVENAGEEPDLPSTRPGDPATVRVLSIHKAKGLEAPIVAFYDSADDQRTQTGVIPLWEEGRIAVGFRGACQPPGWDQLRARDDLRAQAEGKRLLYVACTRARDLLVIPVPPQDAKIGAFWKEVSGRLPSNSDDDVQVLDADTLPDLDGERPHPDLRAIAVAEGGDAVAARWERERREQIEAAAWQPFKPVSATEVASRGASAPMSAFGSKQGRDFGGLVHRILQWIPFDSTPERAQAIADALAPSFDLGEGAAHRAADHAARAMALPVMARARSAPRHWRELDLWMPENGELIRGTVDLVFEEDGQLVVVDYKTDNITAAQALDQAAHHAPQLQLYGRGLAQATGLKVKERLVLFTTLGQTVAV